MKTAESELVWRALAEPCRREILDLLVDAPRSTGEIVEHFPNLCRTAVMKHLDVLVEAKLVLIRREGRVRWNYSNPVPIEQVCQRWINRHVKKLASAAVRLKELVETPIVTLTPGESFSEARGPSPAATASDPPARGRVTSKNATSRKSQASH